MWNYIHAIPKFEDKTGKMEGKEERERQRERKSHVPNICGSQLRKRDCLWLAPLLVLVLVRVLVLVCSESNVVLPQPNPCLRQMRRCSVVHIGKHVYERVRASSCRACRAALNPVSVVQFGGIWLTMGWIATNLTRWATVSRWGKYVCKGW